jgi:predicted RNA-binding Zn-ribbon protein involved in translation (DUF1610 family)
MRAEPTQRKPSSQGETAMIFICRFCGSEAKLLPKTGDMTRYECPNCDTIEITGSAEAVLEANPEKVREHRERIIREQERGIKLHKVLA